MRRAWIPIAALVPLLCGGCSPSPATGEAVRPQETVVRRGRLEERFVLTGVLQSVHSHSLTAPRTERWMEAIRWLAPEGSAVKAGEPVVQFDTSTVQTALKDKELAVTSAASELERTTLELEASRREKRINALRLRVERDKAKLEAEVPPNLQSARDYQEKQLALTRAEVALKKGQASLESFELDAASRLEVLRLELEKAKREVGRIKSTQEELVLKAPVAGVLVHGTHPWEGRKWQVGDSAWAGIVVAEVPDLGAMQVEALLHDVDDGKLAPGLAVQCRLDTYPDRPFAGRIRSISGAAQSLERNSSRRFFTVLVDLDQSDPALMRPGMSVKVEVVQRRLDEALLVPRSALEISAGKARLRVRGRPPLEVKLAGCDALDCALEGGVQEGTALEAQP